MKEQSKQWVLKNKPAPEKAKTVKSADKVMDTVFGMGVELSFLIIWNEEEQLLDNIMRRCWASSAKKERKNILIGGGGVLFHQDNA